MRTPPLLLACVLAAVGASDHRTADAYPTVGPSERHEINPLLRALDRTPPEAPRVLSASIKRPAPGPYFNCDGSTLTFTIGDPTTSRSIGYAVQVVSGVVPPKAQFVGEVLRPDGVGDVVFQWFEQDVAHPFDAKVTIVAIDEAGKRSRPSSPIRVFDADLPTPDARLEGNAADACRPGRPSAC